MAFFRQPERMLVEVRPGEWYLYMEKVESGLKEIDWTKDAEGFGPFLDEADARQFMQATFHSTDGLWTKGYDPRRQIDITERKLIAQAPEKTNWHRRSKLKVVGDV